MIKKQIFTTLIEFESENELEPTDKELVKQACEATKKSYSPYSKFSVGAAILLENGKIIPPREIEDLKLFFSESELA